MRNIILVLLIVMPLMGQVGGVQLVQGNISSGTADGGNPVKVGGVFNTTQPTVTNTQRVDAQFTSRGALIVATGVDTFTAATSAPVDTTTGSTALGALNAVITIALNGNKGAAFQLQSGGTGVYTVTPQCSYDGGTIYNTNGYIQDPVSGNITLTATIASGQATTDYPVMCPQGSSHAQMKVTAFTSGTANWLARSTAITWPGLAWGNVTTAAPTYTTGQINVLSLTTAGALRVDGSGATQPVSGTITANQGGTWTVQPGNTANTTNWLMTTFPKTACGVTAADSGFIANVATAGTDLFTATTCVESLFIGNTTTSNSTYVIQDKTATPNVYTTATPLSANSFVLLAMNGLKFNLGLTVKCGAATTCQAQAFGFQ